MARPTRTDAIGNGPPPRDVLPPGVRPGAVDGAALRRGDRFEPGGAIGRAGGLLPRGAGSLYGVDNRPANGGNIYSG